MDNAPNSSSWELLLNQSNRTNHRDHIVQFYDKPQPLYDAIAIFVGRALADGGGSLVILNDKHRLELEASLMARGFYPEFAIKKKQLVFLNSEQSLAQIMVGKDVDPTKFQELVSPHIDALNQNFRGTRVYGEMVNLLWRDGNQAATLQLERLWNDLSKTRPFNLMCSYNINDFNQCSHESSFHDICHLHSHVIPVEDYDFLMDSESQRRITAFLQQQARALGTEMERRRALEKQLQISTVLSERFLAIANYEFKAPLEAIHKEMENLRLEISSDSPVLGQKFNKSVEVCESHLKKMAEISDKLLTFVPFKGKAANDGN